MTRLQHHLTLIVALVWLGSPARPAQAEIRCTSQSSKVEQLICSDSSLQRLDTRLNEVYAVTGQYVNRDELVKEQRAWLKGTRNACADAICIRKVVNERMRRLTEMQLLGQPIKAEELGEAEAMESCRGIATLAALGQLNALALHGHPVDEGVPPNVQVGAWGLSSADIARLKERIDGMEYPQDIYRIKAGQRAVAKFVKVGMLGTCRSDQIFNVGWALKSDDGGIDQVPDSNDEMRWRRRGNTEYPIYFNGRNYVITGSHNEPNEIYMISVVRPNGRIAPICLAKGKNAGREPTMVRDDALCVAVAEKRISPLQWRDITKVLPINRPPETYRGEFERRYGEYANAVSVLQLDIDGDGVVESVGRFEFNSGSGCGSTQTGLRVMADDNSEVAKSPLNPVLELIGNGSLNIYDFRGRKYIETVGDSQRDTLMTIRNGHVEPVCEFREKWTFEVTPLFKK